MAGFRVAYDPARPAYLSGEQKLQGKTYADGDVLPWRDLGMSETDLLAFWTSGLVYFNPDEPTPPPAVEPKPKRR